MVNIHVQPAYKEVDARVCILEIQNLKIGLINLPCSLMGGNFTFDIAVHCAVLSCQLEIDIMSESR